MRSRGGGWILNVSSATTRLPGPAPWGSDERYERFHREKGPTIYASTKAALERMSAGVAAELRADGIAVNTLAPVGHRCHGGLRAARADGRGGTAALQRAAGAVFCTVRTQWAVARASWARGARAGRQNDGRDGGLTYARDARVRVLLDPDAVPYAMRHELPMMRAAGGGAPMGRIAEPAEIAAVVLSITEPACVFLNGDDVRADGAASA